MLRPHPCRQPEPANHTAIKRWFSDQNNDLFVWLSADGCVTAFQFSYDKTGNEHLLSWGHQHGYSHNRIDDGENVFLHLKMSPIMMPTGSFDCEQLAETFRRISKALESDLAEFIYLKLRGYPDS